MNRRTAIAFALVGCYLVVSMVPVSAASADLVVGSQHTTDSEFNNAQTLENATVVGSGQSASVVADRVAVNDTFTSSSPLGNYTVVNGTGTADWSVNAANRVKSNQTSGGWAALLRDDVTAVSYRVKTNVTLSGDTSNEQPGLIVNWQDSNNHIRIRLNDDTQDLQVTEVVSGTQTQHRVGQDWKRGTGYEVIAESDGGTLTVEVYHPNGTLAESITVQIDSQLQTPGKFGLNSEGLESATGYWNYLSIGSQTNSGTYISQNHSVSRPVSGWTNVTLSNASAAVEWQAWNSSASQWQVVNSSEYDSTGNYTLDVSGGNYGKWRVNVTFNKTGDNPTAELHDEGVLFNPTAPTANNTSASPQGGKTIQQKEVELSIPISDHDFGTPQGDSVTVDFYLDGSQVDTQTISSNQTVSTTVTGLEGGSHTWHVKLEDSYGETKQSDTFTFNSPDTIYIRNETNPTELVKGSNISIEVTFYGDDQTITRETSDGTVDMTGIPTDQEFVVVAQADGWYQRRVIVDNLATQQNIFLLNETEDGVPITFELDDQTGQYPSDTTRLYVQASLNLSSDSQAQWYTIGGDYFGASESYPITLEKGGRYRIVAENDDAPRRELGAYIAEEPKTEPLRIGQVTFDIGGANDTYTWRANYTGVKNDSDYIKFQYSDPQNKTTNFNLTIFNQSNRNDELYSTSNSELGNLSVLRFLNASEENTTWVVNWTAEYDGERITGERALGATKHPVDLDIDPMHQKLLVGLLVVFVAGMFSGPFSRTGAVVVSGLGAILWSMAWLPIPIEYVLAAMAVAVMGRMAYAGGVSSR